MHLETAREIKLELIEFARSWISGHTAPPAPSGPDEPGSGGGMRVAVGLSVAGPAFGVAIRQTRASTFADALAERGQELAGDGFDVREVGRIRTLQWTPEDMQSHQRPLRPGVSIAHAAVTAGTLGAFVTPTDGRAGEIHALSNNHVIADSDRAAVGDVIVQPGPADGGMPPGDRIGSLARVVALDAVAPAVVDAATALLDDGVEVEPNHPAGRVTAVVDVPDTDLAVEKVGRTTGLTSGYVSAIELDGITVEYPTGAAIEFDGQIEITGSAQTPRFSSGGDSGSLVYDPAQLAAVGLLFAGSEYGGPAGAGLTYCNPVPAVLDELGVRLMPS